MLSACLLVELGPLAAVNFISDHVRLTKIDIHLVRLRAELPKLTFPLSCPIVPQ
jgi:hypothetical protein